MNQVRYHRQEKFVHTAQQGFDRIGWLSEFSQASAKFRVGVHW
jgi:hypothetical protein